MLSQQLAFLLFDSFLLCQRHLLDCLSFTDHILLLLFKVLLLPGDRFFFEFDLFEDSGELLLSKLLLLRKVGLFLGELGLHIEQLLSLSLDFAFVRLEEHLFDFDRLSEFVGLMLPHQVLILLVDDLSLVFDLTLV